MKFFARAATILALAAGAGICAIFTPRGFETDLYALVGEGDPVLKAVSEGMDTKVRVLCENADEAERCRRAAEFDPPADPEKIKERYNIDCPEETPGWELLQAAGKKRGYLLARGEIDTERMAKVLLDEFRGGKLGRFTLETPEDLK
jgi:hypothetical protein